MRYIIMDFVEGASAADYLQSIKASGQQGLPEKDALDICIAVTQSLAAAHEHFAIRRDVKPANIVLQRAIGGGPFDLKSARLADLALENVAVSLASSKFTLGSPGYMAPEQVTAAGASGKPADVFSLGATLYALLAGQAPFRGDTPMEILVSTVQKPHTPLREVCPSVSAATAALVDRCLAKDPAARYPDAAALLADLLKCRGVPAQSEGTQPLLPPAARTAQSEPDETTRQFESPQPVRSLKLAFIGALVVALVLLGVCIYLMSGHGNNSDMDVLLGRVDEKLKNCLEEDGALYEARTLLDVEIKPRYQKESRVAARREMVGLYELLAAFKLDEAKKRVYQIQSQYPREPGLADWLKSIRRLIKDWEEQIGDVDEIVKAVKALLKDASAGDTSALVSAEKKIKRARAMIPRYPPLVEVEQEWVKAKQELAEKERGQVRRNELDALLAEAGELLKTGRNLGDAETKLNAAMALAPDDPRLMAAIATLRQRKDFERTLRLAAIALDADDLAEAEAKLATARQLFPNDPRLKELIDTIARRKAAGQAAEQRKRDDFQRLIAEVNVLIEKGNLDQAVEKIRAAEMIFPVDPATKMLREKLRGKQTDAERAEAAKQERLSVIASLDDVLKKDDLVAAKKQLESAEAKYPKDNEVASRRQTYDAMKKDDPLVTTPS